MSTAALTKLRSAARSSLTAAELGVFWPYLRSVTSARRKLRLGSEYGGWTIPEGALSQSSLCYCVGCGEDITFDLALIERYGCEVFAFDPTPRAAHHVRRVAGHQAKYHFKPVGIWSTDGTVKFFEPRNAAEVSHSITNLQSTSSYITVPVVTLSGALEENSHSRLSLLKLDIEGAEANVLDSILKSAVEIDILLVEFDGLARAGVAELRRARSIMGRLLRRGYEVFWIEGRNVTLTLTRPARA